MGSSQRVLEISESCPISHWVKLLESADAVIVVFALSCWRCFKKQPAFRTSEHKSKRSWNWSTRQRLKSLTPTQVWMEQILSRSSTVQLAASAIPVTPVQPAQEVQRTMAQWFNSNRKLMKDCTSTLDQCGYNIASTLEPHKLWMVQCITKKCKDSLAYLLAHSGCRSRRFSFIIVYFLERVKRLWDDHVSLRGIRARICRSTQFVIVVLFPDKSLFCFASDLINTEYIITGYFFF